MLYNLSMESLLNVPTISKRIRIPRKTIDDLASEIASRFRPQKIILFGSYAYGNPGSTSDVDLLVVMETQYSELNQAAEICRTVSYRFGLDLLVYTPQHLAQRLELGDPFLKEITQRGVVLYESTH